jgi:endoglucanase
MARPTGTDANAVQITGKGIATAVLGIPCRYMHTPNERISMNDVEKAISILEAYIVNNE